MDKLISKVMGDGEKKAPVKSIKIKFQKPKKKALTHTLRQKKESRKEEAEEKKLGIKEGTKKDMAFDAKKRKRKKTLLSKMNACKRGSGKRMKLFKKAMEKRNKGIKLTPVSQGHAPKGAHGRAAVRAIGRTKTTGNFAKIEKAYGKGAAVNAYQAKLRAHQGK